jgi:hypothetical protein
MKVKDGYDNGCGCDCLFTGGCVFVLGAFIVFNC